MLQSTGYTRLQISLSGRDDVPLLVLGSYTRGDQSRLVQPLNLRVNFGAVPQIAGIEGGTSDAGALS